MIRLALTGTDTGVGKTLVGTALLAMLRARGLRVSAMKPFDTAPDDDESGSDADVLRAAAGGDDALDLVRPMAIAEPDAPLVSSWQSKVPLDLMKVDDAFAALCEGRNAIVVEGAGGLLGPITTELSFDDLFAAWELDVIIVAPNRRGAINAVRLTERAARTAGLRVRGVVLNAVARDGGGVAGGTNRDALVDLLPGVPIVTFPWVRSVHDLDQLGRVAERHGLATLLPELPSRDAAAFATPMSSATIAAPPRKDAVVPVGSSGVIRPVAATPVPPAPKPVVAPDATAKAAARASAPADVSADAKAVVRPAAKADAQAETKATAKPEMRPEAKVASKAEAKAIATPKADVKPEPKTSAPKVEAKPEPKTVAPKVETTAESSTGVPKWEPQWELAESKVEVKREVTPPAAAPSAPASQAPSRATRPAATRPRPDAIDEAFAAPPTPALPATPAASQPDAPRTNRTSAGGTLRHFDEDDPRLPDEIRAAGPRVERPVKTVGDDRAAPRPPAQPVTDSVVHGAADAKSVGATPAPSAPRPPEPRPAPNVDPHPEAVSEDEAAAAMDRLLAMRASRSTPPESSPAVPAAPRADAPASSTSGSQGATPPSGARASSQSPRESTASAPSASRGDAAPAAATKHDSRPSAHGTPPGGVFRVKDGHSFVLSGEGRDVDLDDDEVASLARSSTPVRHGPPSPPPAPRTRGPMRGAPAGSPVLLQPADASDRLARLDPASGRVHMVFLRELPPGAPVTPAGEYAMVEDTMICIYRAGERLFVNIGERRVEVTDQIESRMVRGGRRGLRRLFPGAGKPNVFQLLRARTVVVNFSYSADGAALPLMTSALTQHLADETEWDFLARVHHILSRPDLRHRYPDA